MSGDSNNRVPEASQTAGDDPPKLDVERCGTLTAYLRYFRHTSPHEVLERLDVDIKAYDESRAHWIAAIIEELQTGEDAVGKRYDDAFAEMKQKLDAERPTLESLGPRRARPDEAKSGESVRAAPPTTLAAALVSEPDVPVEPSPRRPIMTPSYLKEISAPGPQSSVAPIPHPDPVAPGRGNVSEKDVDQTVLGGARTAIAVPFTGTRAAPPAIPIAPSPDAGRTMMAPLPEAVGIAIAAQRAFDPDITQPPVANPLPVVPFSGTTTPERIRQIAGPPPTVPSDEAGETVLVPSPDEMRDIREIVDAARADLPLAKYAALRAALSVQGEDNADVLLRFGLTALQKQAVQQKYFGRFRDEPALRERFEVLLREEMRKLNRGSGGNR